MITSEDMESFLDRMAAEGVTYEVVEPGLWSVRPQGALEFDVVVSLTPPVVLLRVNVMVLPKSEEQRTVLSRRLLELNATDLLHGSYGIDGDAIVLSEALELAHLDFEEFLAAFESMTLSLTSHMRELATYREAR
jgi:hypothetical protein